MQSQTVLRLGNNRSKTKDNRKIVILISAGWWNVLENSTDLEFGSTLSFLSSLFFFGKRCRDVFLRFNFSLRRNEKPREIEMSRQMQLLS